MTRAYICAGIEKICNSNVVVPVFTPNGIFPFDENIDCDSNLDNCFHLFKNGCTITNVYDCPKNSKHQYPKRIIEIKSFHNILFQFCLTRQSNGPVKRYSLIPYIDSEVMYLSDDSHIVLLRESSNMLASTAVASITFEVYYANLKTRETRCYSFDVLNVLGLGSHILVLHGGQLFVCYDNPIKLYMVDFNTFQFYQWTSSGSASRFLTCTNVVVVLDNHNFPKLFLCITFVSNSIYEKFVKKPAVFLGKDKFELPMVLNIQGRMLWIAQNEDILIFLKLHNNKLIVVKKFPFNCNSNINKMNVLIKNMFCLYNNLLFVPMIRIDKDTIGSDCTAEAYELAVIDLHEINILSILRTQCKVDIYTDYIDIASFNQGTSIVVKKLKKSSKYGNDTFFGHLFHLKPKSLKDLAIRVITTNFLYEDVKGSCPSNINLLHYYYC